MATTFNTSSFKISAIRQFIDELIYNTANYYVGVGRAQPWGIPDVAPSPIYDTPANQKQTRRDLVFVNKIQPTNCAFGAKRYNWTQGTVYDFYDDSISPTNPSYSGATDISNAVFYVLTDEMNVYKCLSNNNNSPSIIQPTGTSINLIQTSDGYIWKYLYTIPPYLANAFLSPTTIPVVESLQIPFYSGGSISNAIITSAGNGYTSATISVSGNGSSQTNPYHIQSISIATSGFGYPSAPTITISAPTLPGGVQATATATIDASGRVTTVTLTASGYNYASAPTISVSAPFNGYSVWTPAVQVYLNQILYNNGYFYKVTNAGITGTTAPTITTPLATANDGSAIIELVGIQAVLQINGALQQANLVPVISNGQIVAVDVIDGGIGYTWATLTVSGNGSGAVLTPNLSVGNLTTIQASVELTATKGSLSNIVVTANGSGYSTATVTLSGDGTGATATPIISNGQIKSIQITNYGSGYTWITAQINGNGTGAACRPILAPYNGHGYNAVDELYCPYFLLNYPIGNQTYDSFLLNQQFRQISILKNISPYIGQNYYINQIGTAAYPITAVINTANFSVGQVLTSQTGIGQYLILGVSPSSALLLALNNIPPQNNMILANSSLNTFVVQTVTNPDINAFSGDLIQYSYLNPFSISNTNFITFNCNVTY
jgi:hypothetical protein